MPIALMLVASTKCGTICAISTMNNLFYFYCKLMQFGLLFMHSITILSVLLLDTDVLKFLIFSVRLGASF